MVISTVVRGVSQIPATFRRAPDTPAPPRTYTPPSRGGEAPHTGRGPSSGGDNAGEVSQSRRDLEDVFEKVDSISSIIDNAISYVNSLITGPDIPYCPDPSDVIDPLKKAIEKALALVKKLFDGVMEIAEKVAEIFRWVGDPSRLREVGLSWVTTVGDPATTQTSTVCPAAALPTNGLWTGPAYTAYAARVELQGPAVDEVYSRCVMIDEELNKFADAIVAFWIGFALGCVVLIAGVITGIAECAGVVTIPAGILTATAFVTAYIADVAALVMVITEAQNAAADMMTTVTSAIRNNRAFPGGSWPGPTA
ncbi:hypothetical protein [Microbacterium marinilacus]|uniref:Uncharacterized protein n=1 Tax=Microbacterium marinilacus TaxID=415209 RepID=A0ABP7BGV2_9MICO|nr:hypothetical protein [Microbacterium marinilacus]MBY0689505.1 hypothetical protein [Microbacterium marinilacus]